MRTGRATHPVAEVDRRVRLLSDDDRLCRFSDLRESPYVVLLGEPGMGKSSVFKAEAASTNADFVAARLLALTGVSRPATGLFVDAMDESGGGPSDKAAELAREIERLAPKYWRVSCRSVAWHRELDREAFEAIIPDDAELVVARLEPFDRDDAEKLLAVYGEAHPGRFLEDAARHGAASFIGSPLALKLLREVVASEGRWPRTRFELFASSIKQLAGEHNPQHRRGERPRPETIVDGAGSLCLVMLACGATKIAMDGPEPESADRTLVPEDFDVDGQIFRSTLGSSLFRDAGRSGFEPIHRAVAEFLAAKHLAKLVCGTKTEAAVSFARALQLITGADMRPPTHLRGLYSWFVVHLCNSDMGDRGAELALRDPYAMLADGDFKALPVSTMLAVMADLKDPEREDPWFRTSSVPASATAALSDEALVDDLRDVLVDNPSTHIFAAVLEALTHGAPLPVLEPILHRLMRKHELPAWKRWSAVQAYANATGTDKDDVCLDLLGVLSREPAGAERDALRARLAVALPDRKLARDVLLALFADHVRRPLDVQVNLRHLVARLEETPRPDIFGVGVDAWMPPPAERHRQPEVMNILDRAFAAALDRLPDWSPEQLHERARNARLENYSILGPHSAIAIDGWLGRGEGRDVALLEIIFQTETDGGDAMRAYRALVPGDPSPRFVDVLARRAERGGEAERTRATAALVHLAETVILDDATIARIRSRTSAPGYAGPQLRPRQERNADEAIVAQRLASEFDAEHRHRFDDHLAHLDGIRNGTAVARLGRLAREYFEQRPGTTSSKELATIEDVNRDLAAAADAGWRTIMLSPTAFDIGSLARDDGAEDAEVAALAGLARHLQSRDDRVLPIPMAMAIVVLRNTAKARGAEREQLEAWAIGRLNEDPDEGCRTLHAFWLANVDEGQPRGDASMRIFQNASTGQAATCALQRLLRERSNMDAPLLPPLLVAAAAHLDVASQLALAERALATDLGQDQRALWTFVKYCLDLPGGTSGEPAPLPRDQCFTIFEKLFGLDILRAIARTPGIEPTTLNAAIFRLLGPWLSPDTTDLPGRMPEVMWDLQTIVNTMAGSAPDDALDEFISDPRFSSWSADLRHQKSLRARLRRNDAFRRLTSKDVGAILTGSAPINARDLMAVVVDELKQLRGTMQRSDLPPWAQYWNVDENGTPCEPRPENTCRDLLVWSLRERLKRFRVEVTTEARSVNDTRADVLARSAEAKIPIEIKLDKHRELWRTASTQLQVYAEDPASEGYGILLVLWFGLECQRPGAGRPPPSSATELEAMLKADLAPELTSTTDIIVIDVSNPKSSEPRRRSKGADQPDPRPSAVGRKAPRRSRRGRGRNDGIQPAGRILYPRLLFCSSQT